MHRLLLLLTLAAMPLFSHAIDEPKFEVIRQIDTVELRPALAARGGVSQAGLMARLAGVP